MKKEVKIWVTAMVATVVFFAGSTLPVVQAAGSVSEKDNFYRSVNEKTLETKQIQPTEPAWSWFTEQSLNNTKMLKKELKTIAAKQGTYAKGTPEQKIADLYQCALDTERRNAVAGEHIHQVLAPIQAAATIQELTQSLCDTKKNYGTGAFVDYTADRMPNSLRYAARIVPAGTLLSKYELEKEPSPGAWQDYKAYIAGVLMEAGQTKAEADTGAAAILAMEQRWAPYMLTSEEKNDVAVVNRLYSRKEIESMMPHMNGKKILNSWGIGGEKKVFLADADYLRHIDMEYTDANIKVLKNYAVFRIMNGYAPYAGIKLRDMQRQYIQKRFGIQKSRSDGETANRMVQGLLPYEFGQIYMKDNCTPAMVKDIQTMIGQIRAIYRSRLEKNDWLSPRTKAGAIDKLDSLRVFVGGPATGDKPVIESMPDVIPESAGGDLLGNIIHNAVLTQRQLHELLGTDFDLNKWYAFQPQDVNAAYIPENNSITIPAGILKPPFYSPDVTLGMNLGGIGVIIGHEISHAFDPNGSRYDKEGNMKNWWTKKDYTAFQKKAAQFGPYYSKYAVGSGLYENGALVTNEAIADCGGLSVVTEIAAGRESVLRDMYRNFAAIFAEKMTDQLLLQLVQNDPHPIGEARVNGVLSATDGFYSAYDIRQGDGMYILPKDRVKLW